MERFFSVNRYKKSTKLSSKTFAFKENEGDEVILSSLEETCENELRVTKAVFTVKNTIKEKAGVSVIFEKDSHSLKNYVFAPAALYNGNRFTSLKKPYAPMLTEEEGEKYKNEDTITDVPRLSKDGKTRAQLGVGDMSVPCFGYFSEDEKKAFLVFFTQKNEKGLFGLTVEEKDDKISFILSAPCVREETKYGMCTTADKSDDEGADFKKGDTITFKLREYSFDCESPAELLNKFFALRTHQGLKREHPDCVTWHYASRLIEDKYNDFSWVEEPGYYRSSESAVGPYSHWQTGWVGGCMNTLPGFITGNEKTKRNSAKSMDFVFGPLQHKSGFLYGVYFKGKILGDEFYNIDKKEVVMSRKNADALYYLSKQLHYVKEHGGEIKPEWEKGLKALADAFVSFYDKNGQLAQFINIETETPVVYGTASAGIAPGALALYGKYFGDSEVYLETAEKIAEEYYEKYVLKGCSTGGPGEITACPDSESAFGLLESFVTLYGVTGKEKWLKAAEDTAALCSTWCVAYDYEYDKYSQFAVRNVSSTGAVWASVQNKHAAPGICTLSGASLFLIYRATGDMKYLELCKDIAHNITQFVSTPENPIYHSYIWHGGKADREKKFNIKKAKLLLALKKKGFPVSALYNATFNGSGRINERVNLSDWEGKNNVGEIPGGSCWPEVSTLMTYLEVPGIYVQKDTGFVYTLDHVKCEMKNGVLEITNPTEKDAEYRIFAENSDESKTPIADMASAEFITVKVKAHETIKTQI